MPRVSLIRRLTERPVPVWLLMATADPDTGPDPIGLPELCTELDPALAGCLYRSVNASRLGPVLENGIDVAPTTSVIWVSDATTAWKFGDWPKLLLALDPAGLSRSFVTIGADAPPGEIAAIQSEYPTRREDSTGSRLLFSRLPEEDDHAGSGFEIAYGYWIPGSPFDALRAVLVVVRPSDEVDALIEPIAG